MGGRKLLILCYVSWQTTNCGQTKGHRRCCCRRRRRQWNGYFLLLSVFLSSASVTRDHFLRRTKYAKIWSERAGDKCGRTGEYFHPRSVFTQTETEQKKGTRSTCDILKGVCWILLNIFFFWQENNGRMTLWLCLAASSCLLYCDNPWGKEVLKLEFGGWREDFWMECPPREDDGSFTWEPGVFANLAQPQPLTV